MPVAAGQANEQALRGVSGSQRAPATSQCSRLARTMRTHLELSMSSLPVNATRRSIDYQRRLKPWFRRLVDYAQLEALVRGGESDTLEFKKSTAELTKDGQTLCGFLNTRGGIVLVGVTPQQRIVGQIVSDGTQQEIASTIRRLDPAATADVAMVKLPDGTRDVVVLGVRHVPDLVPFTFDGRPYQRLGTTTAPMPQSLYEQLLLNRAHSRSRWETAIADGVSIDQLDEAEILRTARTTGGSSREFDTDRFNPGDVLDRLGLRRDGALLNAGVVLFGLESAMREYPQCVLHLARFRGADKAEFLDSRRVRGDTFLLLDEALLFMDRHMPVAAHVVPDQLQRVEEPLFPRDALREAMVNALCHRDYSQPSGSVNVAIYDDRWEIWSTGTLPFGLRVDDLKRDHLSRPRNPLIADVLYRRGLFEAWGRGTQRIVQLCVAAGRPEPEFLEQSGAVGVRFSPSGYSPPHRVNYDLTRRQREILRVLALSEGKSSPEIAAEMRAPPSGRSLLRELEELRRLGLVRSTGQTRALRWSLERET